MHFTDPDCFDLVKKISTTVLVDTTERKDLATTPTTDKTRLFQIRSVFFLNRYDDDLVLSYYYEYYTNKDSIQFGY